MFNFRELYNVFYALGKVKSYAVTVILTLGLTLGGLVAVLNLGYQLLLAPLPYPESGQLHYLHGDVVSASGQRTPALPIAAAEAGYRLQPAGQSTAALVGYNQGIAQNLTEAPTLELGYVTPEFFAMLAMPIALGRAFSADEGLNSQNPVAVISYRLWQTQYAKSADVVRQHLQIGGQRFRIVGVSAEHFAEPEILFAGQQTDVWLPWDYVQTPGPERQSWGRLWGKHAMLVKTTPTAETNTVLHHYQNHFTVLFDNAGDKPVDLQNARLQTALTPLHTLVQHQAAEQYPWLLLGTLLLVGLGMVNLRQLSLTRLAARQSQLAIRAAVGARPRDLLRPLLQEWAVLLVLGCSLALIIQLAMLQAFQWLPDGLLPRLSELSLQPISLSVYLLLPAVLTAGLALRLHQQLDYRRLQLSLSSSQKGGLKPIPHRHLWRLLAAQGAVATLVLLFAVQLLLHALTHLWQSPGVLMSDRYHASLDLAALSDTPRQQRRDELLAIRQLLESQPGIEAVSIANLLPLANYGDYQWMTELSDPQHAQVVYSASSSFIDDHYLTVLGAKLIKGRQFSATETSEQRPVVIINERFAKQLSASGNTGKLPQLRWGNDSSETLYQVVGIFADWQLPGMKEPPRALFAGGFSGLPSLLIASQPGIAPNKTSLNQLLASVNPRYRITELRSLADNHASRLTLDRLTAYSTLGLSLLILLLCSAGLSGLLSYCVQLRRNELGIRMAIGARPTTIAGQLLKENLRPVAIGSVCTLFTVFSLIFTVQHPVTQKVAELLNPTPAGILLPVILVLILTSCISLLSMQSILRRPVQHALRGQ
jgi:predicted permease